MVYLTERGTDGLRLVSMDGFEPVAFEAEDKKGARSFQWSPDGKMFVYCNNVQTIVVKAHNFEVLTRVRKWQTFSIFL